MAGPPTASVADVVGSLVIVPRFCENNSVTVKVAIDTKALSEACARFGVARLRVFGSVLTDHFDPQASDIDFLVDFQTGREDRFADFFGLQDELTRIFGRKIDLVVAESVKNPYFKSSVLRGAEDVYAA